MTPAQLLVWLASVAVATFVSVRLGNRKGRPGLGWALGLVLGWIGVIIMLCVPAAARPRTAPVIETKTPPAEPRLPRLLP